MHCCAALAAYPSSLAEQALADDILGIAPHRVYRISLQHYLYLLSVALVLTSLWTGITRYAALWCPDFPNFFGKKFGRPKFSWKMQR